MKTSRSCVSDGKSQLFEQAKGYLMLGEEAVPYGAAAETLRMDEGVVRLAVHRYGRCRTTRSNSVKRLCKF